MSGMTGPGRHRATARNAQPAMPVLRRRGRAAHLNVFALALAASPVLVIALLTVDARMRRASRAREAPAIAHLARRLPTSDLALSGGARWLRAVSVEEPGAAFADGPALPDPDPAGGAIAPPIEVWAASSPAGRASGAGR